MAVYLAGLLVSCGIAYVLGGRRVGAFACGILGPIGWFLAAMTHRSDVRREAAARDEERREASREPTCPRCRRVIADDAKTCPACGGLE